MQWKAPYNPYLVKAPFCGYSFSISATDLPDGAVAGQRCAGGGLVVDGVELRPGVVDQGGEISTRGGLVTQPGENPGGAVARYTPIVLTAVHTLFPKIAPGPPIKKQIDEGLMGISYMYQHRKCVIPAK